MIASGLSRRMPFEDRQQAVLLFGGADGGASANSRAAGVGAGPGAFRTEVEEVGAFVEAIEGQRATAASVSERYAAVTEGVWSDVHDAHHQRARSEFKRAGAQLPFCCGASRRSRHLTGIRCQSE